MKVEITISPIPNLPEPTRAHELAWFYLLDAVIADAYHTRLDVLRLSLPSDVLKGEAQLRGELSQDTSGVNGVGGRVGVALLGLKQVLPAEVQRAYVLHFGVLAPRALRRGKISKKMHGWQLEQWLSIYSAQTYLHGLPIRLSLLLRRPDLYDRAMFAMRRDFVSEGRVPAYYHLSTWSQP